MNKPKKIPKRGEFLGTITEQTSIGPEHKSIRILLTDTGAQAFANAQPGQFVQLACRNMHYPKTSEPLLRRPFSIAGIEPTADNNHIILNVIYRVIGQGTSFLAHRLVGEKINLLGPLGRGFTLPKDINQHAILIGGGVGLPPMFFLASALAQAGHQNPLALAGARSRTGLVCEIDKAAIDPQNPLNPAFAITEFAQSNTPCIITTDDGSCGWRGNVIEALENFLKQQPQWQNAQIYACGPHVMLKAAAAFAEKHNLSCQVCMESYMACGIGVCQSCAVAFKAAAQQQNNDTADGATPDTQKLYKLVCTNGPVFDAKTVLWDDPDNDHNHH